MIVRADLRGSGIGRQLLTRMEQHAAGLDYSTVWVVTGDAVDFYKRCGYRPAETVPLDIGTTAHVLMKRL